MASPLAGAFALVAVLGCSACAKDPSGGDGGTMTTSASSTTFGTSDSTSSSEGETNQTTSDTTESSLSFYAGPSDVGLASECDPFLQDCPEGEKCVPYGDAGGGLSANKCVPISGDGQPGDPCVSGGIVEATDDCGADSVCWELTEVDGMLVGICTQLCEGTADDPTCPPDASCLITNNGSISFCLPNCDPLAQDCGPGRGCYWANNAFACLYSTEQIPEGDPCGLINDCAPSLLCLTAEVLDGCDGSACCATYCDLGTPVCSNPAYECTTFFVPDMAPAGLEDVGVCILPDSP